MIGTVGFYAQQPIQLRAQEGVTFVRKAADQFIGEYVDCMPRLLADGVI